jgi:hypothetical protein
MLKTLVSNLVEFNQFSQSFFGIRRELVLDLGKLDRTRQGSERVPLPMMPATCIR